MKRSASKCLEYISIESAHLKYNIYDIKELWNILVATLMNINVHTYLKSMKYMKQSRILHMLG